MTAFLYRMDEKGSKIYEFFEDGWWLERTDQLVNQGLGEGETRRKVFPIDVYIDETFLTGDGDFTATPLFCRAGTSYFKTPILDCFHCRLVHIPQES